jgi:hypothetical protein
MEKPKAYIIAFLAFCVLSSKNIIIYNEETLVALSFLAFVSFIFHYYGNTIQESLNERGAVIKLELQNLGLGRLDSLDQLFKEHQKLSALNIGLSHVSQFTIRELVGATSQGGTVLKTIFTQQMEQKLKTLSLSKLAIQQKLQEFMADDVLGLVHVHFQRKYMPFNRQLIRNAIQMLSTK